MEHLTDLEFNQVDQGITLDKLLDTKVEELEASIASFYQQFFSSGFSREICEQVPDSPKRNLHEGVIRGEKYNGKPDLISYGLTCSKFDNILRISVNGSIVQAKGERYNVLSREHVHLFCIEARPEYQIVVPGYGRKERDPTTKTTLQVFAEHSGSDNQESLVYCAALRNLKSYFDTNLTKVRELEEVEF